MRTAVTGARAWLEGLPAEVGPQRRLVERLLAWCEADVDVRWLAIGCSFARGNMDRLSDLDLALGVEDEHFEPALARILEVIGEIGDLVESFDEPLPFPLPLRHVVAQYSDRTQIDLSVGVASSSTIPSVVVLYDPAGVVRPVGEEVLDPEPDEVRRWACQAWLALSNVGKYLRRSSPWEALRELGEARAGLFRLWALAEEIPGPRYGVTAILDAPGAALPPGIEQSGSGTAPGDILTAARYLAEQLDDVQQRLGSARPHDVVDDPRRVAPRVVLPSRLASFVVADLEALAAERGAVSEEGSRGR